jgi:aminoglycoside 3-N-acetyltransferase
VRDDLPVTRASIAQDLRSMGLHPGRTLLVHTSLWQVGWVCGGATAVVQALLDVLGPAGTLVVPTFTSDNRDPSRWTAHAVPEHWWPAVRAHLPAFDPAITPSQDMGAVAEQVRTWPGARRSDHPQVSFAAVGRAAGTIVAGHELACHLGERSPLARLEDTDAWVLLLGVGWARCTSFHLAEYRQPDPPVREYACVVADAGERAWVTFTDVDLDQSDFDRIGEAFEAVDRAGTRQIRRGRVGDAAALLFPLRSAVRHATDWLAAHRLRTDRPHRDPGPESDADR